MDRIQDYGVSGDFGMSNQERPDLLQAIKHVRGPRVVQIAGVIEVHRKKKKARSKIERALGRNS